MTAGLCLEAPSTPSTSSIQRQHPLLEEPPPLPGTPPRPQQLAGNPPRQRVQLKTAEEVAAEAAPAPHVVSRVRVTVTSTNGVPDAHINEIRLYDASGVAPFPTRQQ